MKRMISTIMLVFAAVSLLGAVTHEGRAAIVLSDLTGILTMASCLLVISPTSTTARVLRLGLAIVVLLLVVQIVQVIL
jgi:hypothetical protein